jgi:protein-glutamine gamma-glutamyltransferase
VNAPERYLISRNTLLWLIVAQGLAIVPLLLHLPMWLFAVWSAVLTWRFQEFRGRWQMPRSLTKVTLVVTCVAGLFSSYGRLLGLEPMVSMLVCALLLKLLEMQRRKDALLVMYLTFFLIGVQFLFSQTLLTSLYAIICLWGALSSLLSMNQSQGNHRPWRTLRLSGRLLLHSLPLMVLLFLIMPRIGSLWAVPNLSKAAKTGVSDSMSPGDFSSLSRAGGVAFRVTFEGPVPPQHQLYWRGLIFSDFDGRRWTQAEPEDYLRSAGPMIDWQGGRQAQWRALAEGEGPVTQYSVILEATQQNWLYSLQLPSSYEGDMGVGLVRDFRLISKALVNQRSQYRVASQLNNRVEFDALPDWRLKRELQLPEGFNASSIATAKRWRAQTSSDQAYIERVLDHYRASFYYTLEPPALGRDTVDEFLWQTQQGFCEHYASSFVVMMRAAGIPARVVAGYQGGEFNALDNYVIVHQYDAHAWAEVWLEGQGWVRVDPTAAVAPERVNQSLGSLLTNDVEGLMSLGRYRHIPWLASARLHWDSLNYNWHRTVIGFDSDTQTDLLSDWLGDISPLKMVLFVLLSGGSIVLLMTLHLWWTSRAAPKTLAQRYYLRFERALKRKGWVRQSGETAGDFASRIERSHQPVGEAVLSFTHLFESYEYANEDVSRKSWSDALIKVQQSLKAL